MNSMTIARRLASLLFASLLAAAAAAQSYPDRPVRLVVPFAAGSTTDVISRVVAQELSKNLGQPVVVDPRPGANGTIAVAAVAKAAAEGYTIVMGANGTHGMSVSLFSRLAYDPERDFAPITQVGRLSYFLLTGGSAASVQELVALARAEPGRHSFAVTASVNHLVTELFKLAAGIDMVIVPYKAPAQAFVDLASGRVDALFEPLTSSLGQVQDGKLRALAVTSAERSALAPGVPTIAEAGYPGFEAPAWIALFAPAGTPPEIVATLHREAVRSLNAPEVRASLVQHGVDVVGNRPEELAEVVRLEVAKWRRVVREAKIAPIN